MTTKVGRPSKLSPEQKAQICALLAEGCLQRGIAQGHVSHIKAASAPLPVEAIFVTFDAERFFADIDRVRMGRHVTWGHIGRVVGSTSLQHTRLSENPPINALLPLAIWAGLNIDDYARIED